MKTENGLAVEEASFRLLEMTKGERLKVLEFALAKYCKVFEVSIKELENIMQFMNADALQRSINFNLTGAPYNTRHSGNRSSSDYDVFSVRNLI